MSGPILTRQQLQAAADVLEALGSESDRHQSCGCASDTISFSAARIRELADDMEAVS